MYHPLKFLPSVASGIIIFLRVNFFLGFLRFLTDWLKKAKICTGGVLRTGLPGAYL